MRWYESVKKTYLDEGSKNTIDIEDIGELHPEQ